MARSTILIVEDEIMTVRVLDAQLRKLGYDIVGFASTGADAVSMAVEVEPDIVLMDIMLEGKTDGIQAAAEIRRRCQIPVIYLTAHTDQEILERAKLTEPFGFIVKPFTGRELHANIQMALYRHRVESRLRRIEKWFVAAMDEIGDAVVATGPDGRITIFNPAAEVITQWRKEEAIGQPLDRVLRLTDRVTGAPLALDDVSDGPMVCLSDETLLIDRANRTMPIDNTTSCIRDEEDMPAGTVSVFRDPSGRRHGALATLNADVALAAARGVTLGGMLHLCAGSMVRNLNATFAGIWTVNTLGDTLQLQASSGGDADLEARLGRVMAKEGPIGMVAGTRGLYVTNDLPHDEVVGAADWVHGERLTAFAGHPLMIDDRLIGVMAVFSGRHLSDNVIEALESVAHAIAVGVERKRLEEQLRQAQKMEAIGRLAGGIAHDFNNLLTIMSGYSQILLGRTNLDEDSREMITEINAAAGRATSLTRQLLTFSRKQVFEPKVLDLNSLVSNMESMLGRLLGEGIALSISLARRAATVTGDPGQLEQVIMNLAVNASDAMPEGGHLTIETSHVELDPAFAVTYPAAKSGTYVMLAVSDTGCGMTQQQQTHIFEPFYTTKEPGKGTGLGLAMVYGIVQQSGGHIGVYSELNIGTTFKIYLPCETQPDTAAGAQRDTGPTRRGDETILLVEDEHPVRALSRYVLQECGYTVLDAADPEEAFEICDRYEGPIHLIVTDVVLPGMGGRLVAERIAASRPGIKVLYVSGYTDDAVIHHGILQSETAFVQKPFTPTILAGKVRDVLDEKDR